MPLSLVRFSRYALIGVTTFLIDLFLLYVLVEWVGMYFVLAAALSFLLAVTLNYRLSRKYVYFGTSRGVRRTYLNFLLIILVGLSIATGGVYLLVTYAGLHYVPARISASSVAGIINYLVNLHFNFQVAAPAGEGKEYT